MKFCNARKVLRWRKKWKSLGARSGLYGGWSNNSHFSYLRSWTVRAALWVRALSCNSTIPAVSRPRHCFESPSLIVWTSHSTLPTWSLLLHLWTPPAKRLPRRPPEITGAISFLLRKVCLNFFGSGEPLCFHIVNPPHVLTLLYEIQVSSPFAMWSRNFSPSLLYRWRNAEADVMRCFCVPPLAFWVSTFHRLRGSAASLPQFRIVIYVKFVENASVTNYEPPIFTNLVVDFF